MVDQPHNCLEKALHSVGRAIDSLNRQRGAENRIENDPEEILTGKEGRLDSLSLILLLSLVEEEIERETGQEHNLFDEEFLATDLVMQLTVGDLAGYLAGRIE